MSNFIEHGVKEFLQKFGQLINADLEKKIQIIKDGLVHVRFLQFESMDMLIPIEEKGKISGNEISAYWTKHKVHYDYFLSENESIDYCYERFRKYPMFSEYAAMEKNHDQEIILDYGCGPANDIVWYSYKNNLECIIGMDVSLSALKQSQYRLALHDTPKKKARLIHIGDNDEQIPLESETVNFINCQGVLMHTSYPQNILNEFYRIVKKNNKDFVSCVMVYNKSSLWYHLYAAYFIRFIDNGKYVNINREHKKNMSMDELFRRSTDGENCPKADCWTPREFTDMCTKAGFTKIEYMGGYISEREKYFAKKFIKKAIKDKRLEDDHKAFLREVTFDEKGNPMYEGKMCGIGGVYHLYV